MMKMNDTSASFPSLRWLQSAAVTGTQSMIGENFKDKAPPVNVSSDDDWTENAPLFNSSHFSDVTGSSTSDTNGTLLWLPPNGTGTSSWLHSLHSEAIQEINEPSHGKELPAGTILDMEDESQKFLSGQRGPTIPQSQGNMLHIEGVGFIQRPNLTALELLPDPGYDKHSQNNLWESLTHDKNLNLNISQPGHILNGGIFDKTNFWTADYNTFAPSNATLLDVNLSIPDFPHGYLNGYTTEGIIITSILVTVLMIVIVLGNGLVVLAIAIDRNLKAVQNWFIASLAVSDLLVGLMIMPFSLANELMGYWIFGNILCELWLATDVLLCTASIMNLCLISLDRFWSITRAVSYVKQRTKKRAILMIALVWILSMIICFPPLVGWKRPQPTKFGKPLCVLSEDIGYVVYSTLGSFYIPLVVMVVVYFKIYLAARSRARRGLKKPPKQTVINNGKSTSTTTNTTTSFSTPTRDKICKINNIDKEFSSFDEICEEGSKGESGQMSPTDKDPSVKDTMHLSVPNQHLHVHHIDEKKNLLSDENDSACESPVKGHKLNAKHIHFSEDTDSMSDTQGTSNKTCYNAYRPSPHCCSGNEENMKPLLEDSQLESDSQRDCDKLVSHNNNHSRNYERTQEQGATGGGKSGGEGGRREGSGQGEGSDLGKDDMSSEREDSESMNNRMFHGNKKAIVLTPATFSRLNLQMRKNKLEKHEKHKRAQDDPDKQKRKIARAKERRAFIVLGIIMVTFIICWFPFFSTYLISSLTGASVPGLVFTVFFWAGYCNSALNPVTYTIFNRDFRQAFAKILFGRKNWR